MRKWHIKIVRNYDAYFRKKVIIYKYEKQKIIILVSVILVVIVPIFINLSFKVYLSPIFAAEWEAGDLLSYYGSLLGGIITLVGVVMTLNYQTKQSERDDSIKYKPILKFSSVENTCPEFISQREVFVRFPLLSFKDDVYSEAKKQRFEEQMKCVTSFHLLLENKGRGEAVDVSLDNVKLEEVSWDDDSNLYIASSMPLSMGDILVDEKADVIINFPNYLFLKDENTSQNLIRIELKLSYNDMFRRNKKELGVLLDFQVLGETLAPAPYPYKDGFSYYFVRIGFVSALHL